MKYVVVGYGSRGDVEPCIAVAAELQRRGHDVRAALTVPPEMLAAVDSAGLATVPYGRDWQDLLRDNDFTAMLQNVIGSIAQAADYVARTLSEKTSTLMSAAHDADMIVAGMTEQGVAANVAEVHGIPLAALHFFPSQILQSGSSQGGAAWYADRAARQALGLPAQPAAPAFVEIQAYDGICVPRLADEWAGDARRPFVGALTLELPTDADDEVLSWIAAGSPPVYFGFGSIPVAAPADLVAAIGAACDRVGARALICLGPHAFVDTACPDHVKVVRAVGHASVFRTCRAVVHHGGAGTTAAGLRAGTPALVLWNGLDQPMWATAVTQLGVGFGRRFSESTPETLAADLAVLLGPQYAVRAHEVAGQMTAPTDSLCRAADVLEEAAGQRA